MVANIFGPDLGIILVIILLVVVFGSQLPKLARNVGMAGKEFRKAQQEAEEEAERAGKANAASASAASVVPPPPAVGPGPAAPPPVAAPSREESVTLTRSELDALLRAREEETRRDSSASGS
jgi:sec-independent protein translocase protein TatA